MHNIGFFQNLPTISTSRTFLALFFVAFCLGGSHAGQTITPKTDQKPPVTTINKKPTVITAIANKKTTVAAAKKKINRSKKETPKKVQLEIQVQDLTGTPSSISGMQISLRLANRKKAKPLTMTTPGLFWLSPATYTVQITPPKGALAKKYPEAAEYLSSSISKVVLTAKQESVPLLVKVAKRSPKQSPIVTPPPEVTMTPTASNPPSSTPKVEPGTIFIGIESKTPIDQATCMIDKTPVECSQFFSTQGLEVAPGTHTFSIKKGEFQASATQDIKSNQSHHVFLKTTGRILLNLSGSKVKAAQIKVEKMNPKDKDSNIPILTKEITLPGIITLAAGDYKIQVDKEGYHSFILPQVEVLPFEVVKIPVHMVANPEYQEKMCGLCAQNNGKERTTLVLSFGTPDYLTLQAMFGVADFTKHLRLDLGLGLKSSYYLTTVGGTAQLQFVNFPKFSMAGRLYLGGGGGPDGRNNVTFEVGPILTWSPAKIVHISISPYFQVFRDGLAPSLDPLNKTRVQEGYRGMIAPSIEFSLNRFLNMGIELQWAPGTTRKAFTSEFSPKIYSASDDIARGGLYGRVAFTVKIPPFNSSIQ